MEVLESTVINLYLISILKGTTKATTEDVLKLNTLKGTKTTFLTPKRYDEHPCHFYMGVPPRGGSNKDETAGHGYGPTSIGSCRVGVSQSRSAFLRSISLAVMFVCHVAVSIVSVPLSGASVFNPKDPPPPLPRY